MPSQKHRPAVIKDPFADDTLTKFRPQVVKAPERTETTLEDIEQLLAQKPKQRAAQCGCFGEDE